MLEEIRQLEWTNHNIQLTPSDFTVSPEAKCIEEDPRVLALKKHLPVFLKRDFRELMLLDLGCFEGGISLEMAKMGFQVLGIEGRRSNFVKAKLIERYFGMGNLRFVEADVKTLSKDMTGPLDIILCCGLLYHLDDPFSCLEKLFSLLNRPGMFFLDTHFAPLDSHLNACVFKNELSDRVTLAHEKGRYEGRWYNEDIDHEWAAVSNAKSFWPTHRDLVRALYHVGFSSIYEVFGNIDIEEEYAVKERLSRTFFICLR